MYCIKMKDPEFRKRLIEDLGKRLDKREKLLEAKEKWLNYIVQKVF